jgi:flavodoxin
MSSGKKQRLLVYDSWHGNTQLIAEAVVKGMGGEDEVRMVKVDDLGEVETLEIQLLVVGTPVHGGRATEKMQKWIKSLPKGGLEGVKIAAFDTRFRMESHRIGLKLLMKTIGFAAEKVAKSLVGLGGDMVVPAEGFFVKDEQGPLEDGELERAYNWGVTVASDLRT